MASPIALPVTNSGEARHLLRSKLVGADPETIEIAELLVSELVSNAFVHGEGPPLLMAEISEQGHLHVEVFDADSTLTLAPLPPDRSRERGRGLAIVNALATTWGVERRPGGKAVWFDLLLDQI